MIESIKLIRSEFFNEIPNAECRNKLCGIITAPIKPIISFVESPGIPGMNPSMIDPTFGYIND